MGSETLISSISETLKGIKPFPLIACSPAMNESEFKQYIARTILESLMRDFPEETAEAVKKIY